MLSLQLPQEIQCYRSNKPPSNRYNLTHISPPFISLAHSKSCPVCTAKLLETLASPWTTLTMIQSSGGSALPWLKLLSKSRLNVSHCQGHSNNFEWNRNLDGNMKLISVYVQAVLSAVLPRRSQEPLRYAEIKDSKDNGLHCLRLYLRDTTAY